MSDIEHFFEEKKRESKVDGFLSTMSVKSEGLMRDIFVTRPYRGLFKDIEITKGQFITLLLLLLSFTSILMIDIFLSIDFSQNPSVIIETSPGEGVFAISPAGFIVLGLITGFLTGGFIIDRIRGKRYPNLLRLLLISLGISLSHMLIFRRFGSVLPKLLFLGNSFICGLLIMFFLTFYIDFTTILERGRVLAYLIVVISFILGVIILLISIVEYFLLLPVVILGISFYYFFKNRELEEPYKPIEREDPSKSLINYDVVKYIIVLALFAMTIGLFTPSAEIQTLSETGLTGIQFMVATVVSIIVSFLTAAIMGMIFDFYGRKASLANMILAISAVNFFKLFAVQIPYFNSAIVFMAFLACFMSVPLLMSDVASRKNLGKILGIAFTIILFCVVLGVIFGYLITRIMYDVFPSEYTGDIFLAGVINFAAILSLFFLVYMKDNISSKEQNWPDKLIHLYVIHESGVLLYEHSFIDEELAEADLISGGFVGLIALLQEITKEKQRLKSIDHGGKRILFGFNDNKSIIYTLVVSEELITLRNKFFYFIQDIEKFYSINLAEFSGVDSVLWKNRIEPIMKRHFERKYFELIPELTDKGPNNKEKN